MMSSEPPPNLPAPIVTAIKGVAQALTPASLKALDRLVGAVTDIPVAWINQYKARIEGDTHARTLVNTAIAKAAATLAEGDEEMVERAMYTLVRKEYRKQSNREAIAVAMIEQFAEAPSTEPDDAAVEIDEDWLNVFERYAEDASTERMQQLWGRVLAGEARKPGRYSMRTLRFLSEFSQSDGEAFAAFANAAFRDAAPKVLTSPDKGADVRHLIFMESAGLIQGVTGGGLDQNITIPREGYVTLFEGDIGLLYAGDPGAQFVFKTFVLTPLGQELLSIVPGRDVREAARTVATANRIPAIKFAGIIEGRSGTAQLLEVLWCDDESANPFR